MSSLKRVIFTGGPGSGKTSLLQVLEEKNFRLIPETGREVIVEQVKLGGKGLPWEDKVLFRDLMFKRDLEKYKSLEEKEGIFLFDRGLPDSLGYSLLEGLPVPGSLRKNLKEYPYHNKVFLFPPWEEIYQNDAERKQDFETAVKTYEVMKQVYGDLDYHLVEMPKVSIPKRLEFYLSYFKGFK